MNWINAISNLQRQNNAYVLVTIIDTQGSSPRNTQSKMVVDATQSHDTIGGGALEFEAIQHARDLIEDGHAITHRKVFTLGNDLSQCCGGMVEILFEHFPACDFRIALFGAGHVGKAVVSILSGLPCQVDWFDHRADDLQEAWNALHCPDNVTTINVSNSYGAVESCQAGSYFLIMTHSHELDMELCEAVLDRKDSRYCGLIGSKSKAASFRSRLKKKKFSEAELERLTSPMGLALGSNKEPMAVAVSIVAELMQLHESQVSSAKPRLKSV